jgi:predicted transcriptional regulator
MRTGRQDEELSRRERQIMDALYRIGPASAADIRDAIPHPPTYTAVRTHLTLLEEKGLVKHETDGTRYIYEPVVPRDERAKSAIDEVMQTSIAMSPTLLRTSSTVWPRS